MVVFFGKMIYDIIYTALWRLTMNHEVKLESLPAKEFLVIKGFGKIYNSDIMIPDDGNEGTWETIRRQFVDGSVERLQRTANSETVYMLFCYTCTRNDEEKCWVCSYDNLNIWYPLIPKNEGLK
jgi:hypothetical protein